MQLEICKYQLVSVCGSRSVCKNCDHFGGMPVWDNKKRGSSVWSGEPQRIHHLYEKVDRSVRDYSTAAEGMNSYVPSENSEGTEEHTEGLYTMPCPVNAGSQRRWPVFLWRVRCVRIGTSCPFLRKGARWDLYEKTIPQGGRFVHGLENARCLPWGSVLLRRLRLACLRRRGGCCRWRKRRIRHRDTTRRRCVPR